MENQIKKLHNITIDNRKKVVMSGVEKVINYCNNSIDLVTSLGKLTILGKNIEINKFNEGDGELIIDGEIDCLKYAIIKPPIFKRIFK